MSIQYELNQIKSAVYGADVRDAIHDSIKKAYDDASTNGNANMEVEMARGTEPTLNDRLDATDAQLAQKVGGERKAELEDLSENVLSAIAGGEGTNFNLLSIPQNNSVSYNKLDNVTRNNTRFSDTSFSFGSTSFDDKPSSNPVKKHRFSAIESAGYGKIETIEIKTATQGPQRVLIAKIENNKVYLVDTFLVNFSFGKYSYKNGTDFDVDIEIEPNYYIGLSSTSSPYYGGEEGSFSVIDEAVEWSGFDGEDVEKHSYGIAIGIACQTDVVENAKEKLGLSVLESDINDVKSRLYSTSFPDTFLVPRGKEIPRQNYPIYVDSDWLTTKAKITSLNATVHMRRGTSLTSGTTHKAFVDFSTNTIGFFADHSASASNPVIYKQKTVSFPFVSGHEYKVDAIRENGKTATIRITDIFTMESDELSVEAYYVGAGWGYRYVQSAGDITTYDDKVFLTQPTKPRLLAVGDSYIEGGHIHENREGRYSALIKRALHGNAFINGKGGARTADGLEWFNNYLLNDVDAEYTLIAFGMNESDYALWLSNMQTMIDLVTAKGSIPVLVTIPPVAGVYTNPVHSEMSAWIRGSGHLYIDAAIVMSLGGDGLTPDPSKTLADEVHPTIESHNLIYKRALVDVPELFV